MSGWLKRSPTWQFVLLLDGVMVLAVVIGMTAGQWLWHRHLDPSALLGAAVGSAMGTAIIAIGHRHSQGVRRAKCRPPHHLGLMKAGKSRSMPD